MKSPVKWTIVCALGSLSLGGTAAVALQMAQAPVTQEPSFAPPQPRDVTEKEREELVKSLGERFGHKVLPSSAFHAAGAFRFVGDKDYLYIDRSDTGSVAFERASYGIADKALDPRAISREVLLPRIEQAIRRVEPAATDFSFRAFDDEFAGTAEPAKLARDFDPRRTSVHVARTARFERAVSGVPIFGSELIVGLASDGSLGRFRLHGPKLEQRLIDDARKLQEAMKDRKWTVPEGLRGSEIEVLETVAGVGHSGFADPGLRSAAVVRVLVRKTSASKEYPLSSTFYKYFDAAGREVRFSGFPTLPASAVREKKG